MKKFFIILSLIITLQTICMKKDEFDQKVFSTVTNRKPRFYMVSSKDSFIEHALLKNPQIMAIYTHNFDVLIVQCIALRWGKMCKATEYSGFNEFESWITGQKAYQIYQQIKKNLKS